MAKKEGDWGGAWTEKKLNAFGKYVSSYLRILGNQPQWETIYFDGFAGSGDRNGEDDEDHEFFRQLSFTDDEDSGYRGAAERVLTLDDGLLFNFYYFVDNSEKSLEKLKTKLESLPNASKTRLIFKAGNCNEWLGELSKALKSQRYAALILLDPFGMQINWDSISSLRDTRSDVWILVPTGVIINRLLDRTGQLRHLNKLQSFFGLNEEEIRKEFYRAEVTPTLFGDEDKFLIKVVKPIEHIMNLYIRQLKTVWNHVTEQPLRLDNTKGRPLFHLVFASNNTTALRIAKDIIKIK